MNQPWKAPLEARGTEIVDADGLVVARVHSWAYTTEADRANLAEMVRRCNLCPMLEAVAAGMPCHNPPMRGKSKE